MWISKVLPVLLIVLACPPAWSQATSPKEADSPPWVWYTIRPGDTIEGLTVRYLGSRERWRDNAELNKGQFPNPHWIDPGARIKLVLPTGLPADGALVRKVANRVEGQPTPLEWTDARPQDLMRPRDGVRTGEQSSAELTFPDDTALLLTEKSLVFLGEERKAPVEVERTQIEIIVGQADLEGSSGASEPAAKFEIVLGEATATPRAAEGGALQTRARRPESGGAQLMVYGGKSELVAAGAKVTVATGMGTSVPEGEAPSPPEKLLPAADDLRPRAGSAHATPRPAFSWAPVDGAAAYTLEMCRDARCGELLERVVGLRESSWQPARLPVAKLHWRVTAVSASGLDGYPSATRDFTITSDVEETAPPEIAIRFNGPQLLAPRAYLNDRWIAGPGMTVEVEVDDADSGVAEWTPSIDGAPVARGALRGPWTRGEHVIGVVAEDRAGNVGEAELAFIFDPDPPELSWGVEGSSALGGTGGEASDDSAAPSRRWRGRREMKIGRHRWQLDSDLAEVLARPLKGKPVGLVGRIGGAQVEYVGSIRADAGLWVLAEDAVCPDLNDLSYELTAQSGDYVLRIEAIDCVGNVRHAQLRLAKQE